MTENQYSIYLDVKMDKLIVSSLVTLILLISLNNTEASSLRLERGDGNVMSRRDKRDCSGGLASILNPCQDPPRDVTISPGNDIRAEVGQHVTERCNATSRSIYSIEWTKNSVVVSSSSILDISSIQPRHAGLYICTAINSYGRSSASLTVRVSCGGNFRSETGKLKFPGQLDNASKCYYLITVPPAYILTVAFTDQSGWSDSDYTIKIYDGNSKNSRSLDFFFHISKAEYRTSSGNTVFIEYSRKTKGHDIVASYNSESPPEVSPVSEFYNAHYGQSVTLQCNYTSNLPIIAAWWQKQVKEDILNITAEIDRGQYNGSVSLTISNTGQMDSGHYLCMVSNKAGIGMSDDITLSIPESPPEVSPVSAFYYAHYGQSVTLQCNYTSNLPIIAAWWQKQVKEDILNITAEIDRGQYNGSVSLTISNTGQMDSGNYLCMVSSKVGFGMSENITLSIQESPPEVSPVSEFYNAHYGQSVTFQCNYTSNLPIIAAWWQKQVKEDILNITAEIDRGQYDGSVSLTISNTGQMDSGNYLCMVSNKVGIGMSDNITLSIQESPPEVSPVSEFYNAHYGQSVTLQCNYTSNLPIIAAWWQKQVKEDILNITAEIDRGQYDGSVSLTISNTGQMDSGNYLCMVSNKVGIGMSDNITLSIQDINECESITLNTCQHECVNTLGSYECRCWRGYLEDKGRNCRIDYMNIDEHLKTLVITVFIESPFVWNDSLQDSQSPYYKNLESQFIETVNEMMKNYIDYRETVVISLRPGSIIVDFAIIMDTTANASILLQTLQEHVTLQTFGSFKIKNDTISSRSGKGYIYEIHLKKNFIAHEGTTVTVPCIASAISLTRNIDFEWKLNDSAIRPSATSRIQIIYSKVDDTHYKSTLIVKDIQQKDAGNIQCAAVLGEVVHRKSQIDVYRFTQTSTSQTLRSGSNATVNCTIHPPTESAKNTLTMCKDGKIVSDSALSYHRHVAILKLNTLFNSISIGCGWKHEADCTKTINIDVFSPKIKPCQMEYDRDITWSETVPGTTNYQPCPSGFRGLASRQCHLNSYVGQWTEPSFVNCTRQVFVSISEQLERIQDGVAVDEMVNILRTFSNESANVIKSNDSTAADIRAGVEILTIASEIVADRKEITTDERQEIFAATDTLLETEAEHTWEELNQETGANYAAKVMDIVSNVSNTVLKSLPKNGSVNVVLKNMVLQIKRTPIRQITFPDNDVINETTNFKSQVILSEETIQHSLDGVFAMKVYNHPTLSLGLAFKIQYEVKVKEYTLMVFIFSSSEMNEEVSSLVVCSMILPYRLYFVNHACSTNHASFVEIIHMHIKEQDVYMVVAMEVNFSQKTLGSPVVAFSIPKDIIKRNLNPPIQLLFETFETNLTHKECSYWNFDLANGGNWATDGCEIYSNNENVTECRCNHLTNFAVLLSLQEIPATHHEILSTLSLIGCIISIICVVLTLIVYTVEWKNLSSDKSVILVIMCIVILISYITFLVGIEKTDNKDVCTAIAVSLHFLFLTILFLMAAEGIIHAVLVISVFPQRRSINRILLPLVFGLPTVIVVISGIVTKLDGYGTEKLCWISTENGLIFAFFVPCLAVVLMNFIITGLVLRTLFSTRATMSKTRREKLITGIRSIIILAPVFGLTWVFGLLSFSEDMILFSYLFVVFNSLQGFLIFVLHGIMNENLKLKHLEIPKAQKVEWLKEDKEHKGSTQLRKTQVKKSVKKRASRIMKQQDYITFTKSTESTNTWNVFKKVKPRKNSKPSDVSDCTLGPAITMINPTYSGISTDAPVVEPVVERTGMPVV